MDFVNRHVANESSSSSSGTGNVVGTSSGNVSLNQSVLEEPEYYSRYMVVKHSWRGRYKRILCLSSSRIVTLDPGTLAVTNSYDVGSDFEGAAPIIGRDDNSFEFSISVRSDGKGKFKGMKFSSKYRASIMTELHRLRWNRIGPIAEFPVLHLRRRKGDWVPLVSTRLHSLSLVNF